ncbi:MAG TPA: non-homologous end-joining DNA ligase [bacterium]|nr:non-homologous end-joining DNA ligase [bacterium]
MTHSKARRAAPQGLPVPVTHPDKVFWPEEGYTKLDLANFYNAIFPHLAPFVKDRLLILERCPDGMRGQCFYQREAPRELPPGIPTKRVHDETGVTEYVVGGSRETQLELVNLGCIAVHVWGSRAEDPRRADWVCFDLDPTSGEFADAARAGLLVKKALDALDVASYPKTSGGRGLHVFVPIRVGPDTKEVLGFAESFVRGLAEAHPKDLTVEAHIAARGGRVYLDAFRNGFAQAVVAPFSVRRRPKAPVSTPLDWSEVTPSLVPSEFNLGNFSKRLKGSNPWKDFFQKRQSLDAIMRRISHL